MVRRGHQNGLKYRRHSPEDNVDRYIVDIANFLLEADPFALSSVRVTIRTYELCGVLWHVYRIKEEKKKEKKFLFLKRPGDEKKIDE